MPEIYKRIEFNSKSTKQKNRYIKRLSEKHANYWLIKNPFEEFWSPRGLLLFTYRNIQELY
jgi:hypothetical protein